MASAPAPNPIPVFQAAPPIDLGSAQSGAMYNPRSFTQNDAAPVPGSIPMGPSIGGNKLRSKGEMLQQFLVNSVNDPEATTALQQDLIRAGYLSPKSRSFTPGDIQPGDATFYALSSLLDKSFVTKTDYQQILADGAAKNPGKNAYEYYVRKFGPDGTGGGLMHIHTENTQQSSPMDAEGILRNTFQTFEGRDPTQTEIAAFTTALQHAQAANPSVMDGSYDPALGYRGDRQVTTSGGLSQEGMQAVAQNFATGGANQSAANAHSIHQYTQMFEQALKGGG